MTGLQKRLERLEENAPPSHPWRTRIVFEGDPLPQDLARGETVCRVIFGRSTEEGSLQRER